MKRSSDLIAAAIERVRSLVLSYPVVSPSYAIGFDLDSLCWKQEWMWWLHWCLHCMLLLLSSFPSALHTRFQLYSHWDQHQVWERRQIRPSQQSLLRLLWCYNTLPERVFQCSLLISLQPFQWTRMNCRWWLWAGTSLAGQHWSRLSNHCCRDSRGTSTCPVGTRWRRCSTRS